MIDLPETHAIADKNYDLEEWRSVISADKNVMNCGRTCRKLYYIAQRVLRGLQTEIKNTTCDDYNIVHNIKTWGHMHRWRDHRVQYCKRVEERDRLVCSNT